MTVPSIADASRFSHTVGLPKLNWEMLALLKPEQAKEVNHVSVLKVMTDCTTSHPCR